MTVLKVTKPDHVPVPAATILKVPTSKSPLQQHLMSPLQGNSLLSKASLPIRSESAISAQVVMTTSSSLDTRTPVTQLLARTLEKRQKQQQSAIVTGIKLIIQLSLGDSKICLCPVISGKLH
jgi:hypothetical protein